jgi:hypothetical protein
MAIKITMTVTGLAEAIKLIGKVEDMVRDHTDEFALAGLHGAAKIFDQNFANEGSHVGGWPSLAESTVRERSALGVGGSHPILVRYQDLRDYTATFLQGAGASTTFAVTDPQGGSLNVRLTSGNGAVNVTASGTKAVHQTGTRDGHIPARPYWFVNQPVLRAAKAEAVKELAKQIGRIT